MRLTIVVLAALAEAAQAQTAPLTSADSALVGRILLAEDRRDSTDAVLREGAAHADARVRVLAQRALWRIRDPQFAARDSLPALPSPPVWPEPAWRLRFRALAQQRDDCGALRAALVDSAWPVRFRAAALARESCASDDAMIAMLRDWYRSLPPEVELGPRPAGNVGWHPKAHAVVALARLRPEYARNEMGKLSRHARWQVRMYTARAAGMIADTTTLRHLVRDTNPNVIEAAVEGLSRLTAHADDSIYVRLLGNPHAQAVRAAAIALKGSSLDVAAAKAARTFDHWVGRQNASERDVRVALREAALKTAADDKPPPIRAELPPQAVALALGADVRLSVTMADPKGGASFVVRLRGDVAPMMAARVLALANAGYYDRTLWHRVEHDFVVQGGGPGANEYVGYKDYFRDELGNVSHLRGTVGMSTRGHDTGDAQWFFNLKDNLRLNRDYTVFAEVIEGIEVLDAIMEGDRIASIREVAFSPR